MNDDPRLVAIAHAIGAEIDRQTYSHYRPTDGEQELRNVLVDGDLDLIALAAVALKAAKP
jgi:hypothetical protein